MGDEATDGWPNYGTDENKEYRFRPIKGKALRFHVKAAHDCHVALSSNDEGSNPMVEVFIGAWQGASSAIRWNKDDDLVKVDTPDILNEDEPREFWITWDDGVVRVGHGKDHEPFMFATLPESLEVTHFGYSTGWGAIGWWQFYNERILPTADCLAYNYEPLYGTSLTFSVACTNDAHLSLSSAPEDTSPMYEIFLGGWGNQRSAIRLNKGAVGEKDGSEYKGGVDMIKVDTPDIVCGDVEREFWISVSNGNIRVGHVGTPDPVMEWTDPEPWKVTHVGYCTGWGAVGKWQIDL